MTTSATATTKTSTILVATTTTEIETSTKKFLPPLKPTTSYAPDSPENSIDPDSATVDLEIIISIISSCCVTITVGASIRIIIKWRKGTLKICCRARPDPESSRAGLVTGYGPMNETTLTGTSVLNPNHTSTPVRIQEAPRSSKKLKFPRLKTLKEILDPENLQGMEMSEREGNVTIPENFVRCPAPEPENSDEVSEGIRETEEVQEPQNQNQATTANVQVHIPENDLLTTTQFFEALTVRGDYFSSLYILHFFKAYFLRFIANSYN